MSSKRSALKTLCVLKSSKRSALKTLCVLKSISHLCRNADCSPWCRSDPGHWDLLPDAVACSDELVHLGASHASLHTSPVNRHHSLTHITFQQASLLKTHQVSKGITCLPHITHYFTNPVRSTLKAQPKIDLYIAFSCLRSLVPFSSRQLPGIKRTKDKLV